MKPEDKPKYVEEARQLLGSIDVDYLVANHNDLEEIAKINRLAVIFIKFSLNDGERLVELLKSFQNWARRSTSAGTIKNRAVDMLQFIDRKIGDMSEYVIEPVTKDDVERIKRKLKDEELWVQSNIQGDEEHIFIGNRDDKDGRKVHLVVGKTGEIRVDPSDKPPGELLDRVTSITTRAAGKRISFTKATLEFLPSESDGFEPGVSVYLANKRGHLLVEVYNSGSEDLKDISVEANWMDAGKENKKRLTKFFDEDQDPLFARPSGLNILRKAERKFATNIPGISQDGLLRIAVVGRGVTSKRDMEEEFTIKLPR